MAQQLWIPDNHSILNSDPFADLKNNIMKIISGGVLLLLNCCVLYAQQPQVSDSVAFGIINLREVTVVKQQTAIQQKMVTLYRSNQASTLEDILARLPEISLIRRGAYGMEPAIRSFTGGQINVLIDGMRIHGACTDRMDPATIYVEPQNLDQLQVQTAGTGNLYGSSIGGTLNMKMAEPQYNKEKSFNGSLSSGFQTAARSWFESLRLNYSNGRWALRANGTWRKQSEYRAGGGSSVPFSAFEKMNYGLSAKYQLNQHTWLRADLLGDDGWNIGYPALPMDVGYAAARIGSVSLHQLRNTSRLYSLEVKLYANSIRHFMDDTHRPNVPMHMDMPGISRTAGAYAEAGIRTGKHHRLQLRADFSSTLLSASMTMYAPGEAPMYMLTWPDNRKMQGGLSASWSWQADSNWRLQLGSRLDAIIYRITSSEAKDQAAILGLRGDGRNDWLRNGSLQISRKLGDAWKASAGISTQERIPSASELYGFYLFNSSDGFDYIGSPQLGTERSWQADASVSFNTHQSAFKLSGYYSRLSGYIIGLTEPGMSTMTIGARGVKSYVNLPSAIVYGLEASAIIHAADKLDLLSSLRYTVGADHQSEPLPMISPLRNSSSLRWRGNLFSLQAESDWSLAQNRFSPAAGEDATPAFLLLHLRGSYAAILGKQKLELQGGVENILDRKYHEHTDWGNILRPGRNVYLQVKWIF
jgi:iron complex outermembrane receptor protein